MFRGCSNISLDSKGRLAIPSRYRDYIRGQAGNAMVLTLNPLERSLWLYLFPEWEVTETKLANLSDFDRTHRRIKQMMHGYATDCQLDNQGRILVPKELREYAKLDQASVMLGQSNKFEIWDAAIWSEQQDQWLESIDSGDTEASESLRSLAL